MASMTIPGPICKIPVKANSIAGTFGHGLSHLPGPINDEAYNSTYSYSISGKVGALGSMLFTAIFQRLPGTLYDHTLATTNLRDQEAYLGLSEFTDASFKESANIILKSLKTPAIVDVDIHFQTNKRIENITVRGSKGVSFFYFDLNELEKTSKPENGLKPMTDIIDSILATITQLR